MSRVRCAAVSNPARPAFVLLVLALVASLLTSSAHARPLAGSVAHAAAVCADFPNQAAAQRAANTVDADGDGIYCESLPCRA